MQNGLIDVQRGACAAPQRRFRIPAGFTLIELLVVIAIIAVLASLLMPAISSGFTAGERASCTANLKQIASAAFQYGSDHGGKLPTVMHYWGGESWDRNLRGYDGRPEDADYRDPYALYRCPGNKLSYEGNILGQRNYKMFELVADFKGATNTNDINSVLIETIRPSAVSDPSELVFFFDSYGGRMGQAGHAGHAEFARSAFIRETPARTNVPSGGQLMRPRNTDQRMYRYGNYVPVYSNPPLHGATFNYIYFDGHAEHFSDEDWFYIKAADDSVVSTHP